MSAVRAVPHLVGRARAVPNTYREEVMRPIAGTVTDPSFDYAAAVSVEAKPYVPDVIPTHEDSIVQVFKLLVEQQDKVDQQRRLPYPATLREWEIGKLAGLESAAYALTFISFEELYEVGKQHLEARESGYQGTIASTWTAILASRPAPKFRVEVVGRAS